MIQLDDFTKMATSMCYWTNLKWKLSEGACTASFDHSHRGFFILSGANVSQLLLMAAHTWLPPLLNLVAGQNWFTTAKNKIKIFSSATFSQVLSHSSAVGSCGFSSEMSPLTFPWASFSHIPILISLHTQKRSLLAQFAWWGLKNSSAKHFVWLFNQI